MLPLVIYGLGGIQIEMHTHAYVSVCMKVISRNQTQAGLPGKKIFRMFPVIKPKFFSGILFPRSFVATP